MHLCSRMRSPGRARLRRIFAPASTQRNWQLPHANLPPPTQYGRGRPWFACQPAQASTSSSSSPHLQPQQFPSPSCSTIIPLPPPRQSAHRHVRPLQLPLPAARAPPAHLHERLRPPLHARHHGPPQERRHGRVLEERQGRRAAEPLHKHMLCADGGLDPDKLDGRGCCSCSWWRGFGERAAAFGGEG